MCDQPSRRQFLAALPAAAVALAALARPLRASVIPPRPGPDHPDPRPGIDASHVLKPEDLQDVPDVIPIYDGVREIPQIVDGIRCHCGCADLPGYRSLLTCYEEGGMAKFCPICQGQGRLAYRRYQEGQSLDQIRNAIDARFGGAGEMKHHPGRM